MSRTSVPTTMPGMNTRSSVLIMSICRVCMPGERVLALYAPRVVLHAEQVTTRCRCTEQQTDANPLRHRTDAVNKYTIYPYVHSFSNNRNPDALLRPITIPDVLPSSLPSLGRPLLPLLMTLHLRESGRGESGYARTVWLIPLLLFEFFVLSRTIR